MPRWGHDSKRLSVKVRKNEKGKEKYFVFALSSSSKKKKNSPPPPNSPLPPFKTINQNRPCSAAAPPSSSTASACSPRGPRPRGLPSSTGGSRRRSGTSTGEKPEERKRPLVSISPPPCCSPPFSLIVHSIYIQHLPAALFSIPLTSALTSNFTQRANETNAKQNKNFYY